MAEIKGIIEAGIEDLNHAGIDVSEIYNGSTFDELLLSAVLVYVRLNFGEPGNASFLAESYAMKKAELQNSSKYNRSLMER